MRFLGSETVPVPLERARIAILPVPYEGTVSYGGGTANGPRAILDASQELESFSERSASLPADAGIWTDPPLGVGSRDSGETVARRVTSRFGELLDSGAWPIMLGGEHSLTPHAVAATAERHERLHVVQFDAHADLRETYGGRADSHACAMARCLPHATISAVGIRSYSHAEAERMRAGIPGYRITHGWELDREGWIDRALEGVDGRTVYLTFDVDYFDPSVIPATGTPEPGGGTWWSTLDVLDALFQRANVVAADVVELAPIAGLHHADFTVARLVYHLIGLALARSRPEKPREPGFGWMLDTVADGCLPLTNAMITGFNTDIDHLGKIYHVQTEDRGLRNPVVESLIYTGGEIIASRKTPYLDLVTDGVGDEAAIQKRMEQQHRDLIGEIKSGVFAPQEEQMPFGHSIVTNRSLDAVVLEFLKEACALERLELDLTEPDIVWEGEPTTLKIKVFDPDTERPVHGATVIVRLVSTGERARELVSATSDGKGLVEMLCNIPSYPGANAAIVCEASVSGTHAELQRLIRKRTEASA